MKKSTKDLVDEMDVIYKRMKTLMIKSRDNNDQKDAPIIKTMAIEIRALHQEIINIHNKEIMDIESIIKMLSKYSPPSN